MAKGSYALVVVAALACAEVAQAQIVTLNPPEVPDTNPMTVKVSGKYSVHQNQANDSLRIKIDYVTIGNGTVAVWLDGPVVPLAPAGGALTAWAQLTATTLNPNPPAELFVRVRLQRYELSVLSPPAAWFTKSTAVFQITPSKVNDGPPMDN